MQLTTVDGVGERRFLIAAVTNTPFLSRLSGKLPKEPCRSRFANVLLSWCQEHLTKYGTAPGQAIEVWFSTWTGDRETKGLLDTFLRSLSSEAERLQDLDVAFELATAEKYLNTVALEKHAERLRQALESGFVSEALQNQETFKQIRLTDSPRVELLRDKEAQRSALEDKQRVLVRYSGPAGDFFGSEMAEDSFVGFMAPPKGGKSYILLDTAWRAMLQGQRVAYFQVGDLTQNQIIRRFHRRAARRPLAAKVCKYPTGIMLTEDGKTPATVTHDYLPYEKPLTWSAGEKAFEQVAAKSNGDLWLSYHPLKTISVAGIRSTLKEWDAEGYVANVVIVDYASNLLPVDERSDSVRQTADTWAMLRQLSEIRQCLVVTASQTNKEGFSAWVLSRKHFSESKMILAHVTAFFGINQTPEERHNHVVRLNTIVAREGELSETDCLHCASCLDICNYAVLAAMADRQQQPQG